jgi:MFS family permease
MESPQAESAVDLEISKHLRHNLVANLLDGGFFGLAIGFASFVTVIPLFVSTLTDSPILIGLIPAIHNMGWQLPQLLTSNRVARLGRYKPMVVLMTINERLPFFGLAVVAWLVPVLDRQAALALIFALLIWQGMGGGLTATAWQSMVSKIIPPHQRGRFYGFQSSMSNLFASVGAIGAGFLLQYLGSPFGFVVCFACASVAMVISWFFVATTREPEHRVPPPVARSRIFRTGLVSILRDDGNFRWYLVARMLSQFAGTGFAFYIVYIVRRYGVSVELAGFMTGTLLVTQIVANGVLGWIGDRKGHQVAMKIGALAALMSGGVAWWAPEVAWFFLAFVLAGIANAALWTSSLAMILDFGTSAERPAYIGLANTLVAPSTILAPLVGGWMADLAGYPVTFLVSIAGAAATFAVVHLTVHDPRPPAYGKGKPRPAV